ncbi:MAG: ankyrin repeat domain-containing protein [Planctomycetota bacterium]
MPDTESFIQILEQGPLHELTDRLDADPRRMNTFLVQPAPHGPEQWMPMHYAARAGYLPAVEALLARGVHPDCRTRFTTPMHARQTPLHLAASAGHAEVVRCLLGAGAEVEVRDAQQRSPLWCAARHRRPEATALLLAHGASIDARDTQQRTPLHATLLHRPSAEPSFQLDRDPEALRSVFTGSQDAPGFEPAAALSLIKAGADLTATCAKEPDGFTVLHRCITLGEAALPVAERLLERGADRSVVDPRYGRTALDLARELGLTVYVDLLSA